MVQPSLQLDFDLAKFRLQPFPHRLPKHYEFPIPCLVTRMCEAKKVERLGLPLAAPFAVLGSIAAEFHQARLFGVQWRCCTARSKSLTSLCRLQSHPAQYVSGIPSAAILLSISHPIRCSTRCLANVRARISGPMIAL